MQSYAPTFYVQQGLKTLAFTYNIIGQVLGIVGCAVGIVLFDMSNKYRTLCHPESQSPWPAISSLLCGETLGMDGDQAGKVAMLVLSIFSSEVH